MAGKPRKPRPAEPKTGYRHPRSSSLKSRIFLFFGGVILFFSLAIIYDQRYYILPSFVRLENESLQRKIESTRNILQREIDDLARLCQDWAYWDAAYDFIQTGDPGFIRENMLFNIFPEQKLTAIIFLDRNGGPRFHRVVDPEQQKLTDIPILRAEGFNREHPLFIDPQEADPLLQTRIAGLLDSAAGPLLCAAYPIITSENRGPMRGTLIFCRRLEDLRDEIQAQTQLPLEFLSTGSPRGAALYRSYFKSKQDLPHVIKNSRTATILIPMPQLNGTDHYLIRAEIPRSIYREGKALLTDAGSSTMIIQLILLIIFLFYIHLVVLTPLEKLRYHIGSIIDTGDYSSRMPEERSDEFGMLTDDFNHLLDDIERGRREIHEKNISLNSSRKAAEEANSAKTRFLANINHEIRTPLNSIMAFAELLDEAIPPEAREFTSGIKKNCQSLQYLFQDMVNISDIEAGRVTLTPQWVSMPDLAAELFQNHRRPFQDKGLTLLITLEAGFPLEIYLDGERLKEILNNLLSNALKYSPDGIVRLDFSSAGSTVTALVSDSGPGIPEQERERLFKLFERGNSEKQRGIPGTGIGLTIARRLARCLEGELRALPQQDRGARFLLELFSPRTGTGLTGQPIRYQTRRHPAPPKPAPDPAARSSALDPILQGLKEEWKGIRSRAFVDEFESFGRRVNNTARNHHFPELEKWSRELLGAAAIYDIAALKNIAARFDEVFPQL